MLPKSCWYLRKNPNKRTNAHKIFCLKFLTHIVKFAQYYIIYFFKTCFFFFLSPDIDECNDDALNVCEQQCTNTVGGFTCSCNKGYNVDPSDPNKCVGMYSYTQYFILTSLYYIQAFFNVKLWLYVMYIGKMKIIYRLSSVHMHL